MRKIRTPRTERPEVEEVHESFASAHKSARSEGYTGTVELSDDDALGGAVFLSGVVVYARHRRDVAESALDSLLSEEDTHTRRLPSTSDAVRMFRTYLRYISDDGLLTTEPLDRATVESQEVEGLILEGVRNSAEATTFSTRSSMTAKAEEPPRSFLPEGKRTALAPDRRSLRKHVSDGEASGYAVGDYEVVTFQEGEVVDQRNAEVRPSVRTDVGVGDGWVVVETDHKKDTDGKGSFLSRVF